MLELQYEHSVVGFVFPRRDPQNALLVPSRMDCPEQENIQKHRICPQETRSLILSD